MYLNPENTVPNNGLTSFGIAVPIGQGLLINQRMADLRKAKIAQNLNQAERTLQATEVLFEAAISYTAWKRSFDELKLYENYFKNAEIRYKGISKLIEQGDKPAIDSIEAGIVVKTRQLNLEQARLKVRKAQLELSNYLWLENNIPLELKENLIPDANLAFQIPQAFQLHNLAEINLDNHPKIKALDAKINMLKIDKQLKSNNLLPKLNLSYNYLSEPGFTNSGRIEDYKIGLNFEFPLFLRKERAGLKLAKLKIQDSEYGLLFERKSIENKLKAQQQELQSLEKQQNYNNNLVKDFNTLLTAEDKLFEMGESSLFVINSRENALVSSQLNKILLENTYFNALLNLFKTIANPN